ncbi:hypothetical protein P4E94_09960 [Pontiellaceae bacterium B12219]|nr:hypothetical protein [Pontiellaceae bacterium B12219]
MKNKEVRAWIGLVTAGMMVSTTNAAVITSVTALDGAGASFTLTTSAVVSDLTTAVVQSFVVDGITYTPVSAALSGASCLSAAGL